ncbi:MAG TPA: molybdate ABC transporter permease subunit [Chryseolinea sp.]
MVQWDPFVLTFKLATITTVILFLLSVPLAYWLTYSRYKIKYVVEALVSLPLILPPSVLGFYLLLAFSPRNAFGKFLEQYLDLRLVFTFEGLIVASILYSLPFMVQPIHNGLKLLPASLVEASYTLGKGRLTTLLRVLLPNIRTSLITAIVLSFAHTIGEFGVVLMVGGNIPRETRVVSIALYDEVEAMNYGQANLYAVTLLLFAFLTLLIVYLVNYRSRITKVI